MKTNQKRNEKQNETKPGLRALGAKVTKFERLECFEAPADVKQVRCISDEVTALCPVTGQPDWYTVDIQYTPDKLCVESKTLKLFLQKYRNEGHFCEQFAHVIARELYKVLCPFEIQVTVVQKPRGGVSITSVAFIECSCE